ncbi:MAG: DUF5667 domain-containing protein [Candidatus Promineifilaceae bacterium]
MTIRANAGLLDEALDRLRQGQSAEDILKAYPKYADDLRPLLQATEALRMAQSVDEPAAESLVSARNDFLAEITELQLNPVSPSLIVRLKGWISQKTMWSSLLPSVQQKEMRKMSVLALKIALILVIAFGSVGGTFAAAADSLPGTAAYPIKLAIEKARLAFSDDSEERTILHLEYARERIQEIVRLAQNNELPGDELLARTQTHMRSAYELIAQVDDEMMNGLLAEAQAVAQNGKSDLEAVQEQVQSRVQKRLQEASHMMAQWQYTAEYGMQDPAYIRWRFGPGEPPCEGDECLPPYGDGDQEQNQHQYGPGEPLCEGDDCLPPYGDGDQDQYQHQYGPGEPPCEGDECMPPYGDGDQEQYQHQNGPGEPPCEGDECLPPYGDGDQDQNQEQQGPGEPPCEGDECMPPNGGGDQDQNQEQQGPGEPPCEGDECMPPYGDGDQYQNQDQQGPGGNNSQPGGSPDPGSSSSPGRSMGDGGGSSGSAGGRG